MLELKDFKQAASRLRGVINKTPLEFNERLSARSGAKIYLKREDGQPVRSYKIRGAYNFISALTPADRRRGVVCASAGNHAQGVALACKLLKIRGIIFMPRNTPKQKIDRVRTLGAKFVDIKLAGDTFDAASQVAQTFAREQKMVFVHPFDDPLVIAGQGTIGLELLKQSPKKIDYLLVPVGGGGLISGLGLVFKELSPKTKVIGVEPAGAPSMFESLRRKKIIELDKIDKFVDGAAVRRPGELTFKICQAVAEKVLLVPEGKICQEMIALYQNEGIVTEPAGALALSALDQLVRQIKGKTVVCILSGSNNDISRYAEVMEKSLIYQGLKHYFIIEFSQRPGALRQYLDEALGANDDITRFEYIKKNNREFGPALVGVELMRREDLPPLLARMKKIGMIFELITPDSILFRFLI